MPELSDRLNAYRADLADAKLKGKVESQRFVSGTTMRISASVASLRREPSPTAMQTTQALFGERIIVFDGRDDWLWCQLERDSYVGYIEKQNVSNVVDSPTHRVAVASTLLYPRPDIKSQPTQFLPMNARLEIGETDETFSKLGDGRFVSTAHIKAATDYDKDFVGVAENFLGVPYYWGGKTITGLDCSGLVQTALEACGIPALRDADMQESQLGQSLLINDLDGLRRGDLIFWKGHVGIMSDDKTLLHANGHHMLTVKEPLAEAAQRIAQSGSQITSIKRL